MKSQVWRLLTVIGLASVVGSQQLTLGAAESATEKKSTTSSAGTEAKPSEPAVKKVDVNTATKAELQTLPGIGSATADAIIAARPYKTIDELKNVPGIGEAKFSSLRTHVKVSRARVANEGTPGTVTAHPNKSAQGSSAADYKSKTEKGSSTGPASTTDGKVNPGNPPPVSDDRRAGTRSPATESKGHTSNESVNRTATAGKVDLNKATFEELESLPGIGPVKAQAIIDGRPFKNPEDVMNVKGIKEGTFNEIKDRITVR